MALTPVREPLDGSASSGQCAVSASTRAGGPASSPATTTVRGPDGSVTCSAGRIRCTTGPGATSGAQRSSGTSGSPSGTLRCTGPVVSRSYDAVASWVATSGPNTPTWSVVWLALVPRSRAGRSAVTTTSAT